MLPLEFIVIGTPKSVQAPSRAKAKWKADVRSSAIAAAGLASIVPTTDVRVTILYFYVRTDLDVDNIVKPILDAMNSIAYIDDDQVIDLIAAKRDLANDYTVAAVSPVLAAQLPGPGRAASDFVFVRVEAADTKVLP
jgi:Holliday junction resolvase RusA-like endonuclease